MNRPTRFAMTAVDRRFWFRNHPLHGGDLEPREGLVGQAGKSLGSWSEWCPGRSRHLSVRLMTGALIGHIRLFSNKSVITVSEMPLIWSSKPLLVGGTRLPLFWLAPGRAAQVGPQRCPGPPAQQSYTWVALRKVA